jgi:hypothetical protein
MSHSPKPSRKRRYLAVAGVSALAASAVPQQLARAAVPFGSAPLAEDRVIALAQPLSDDRWNLIVLEQREPAPPCWRRNANGSVLTYEMHLPETTCGRYLSSSSYSLRVAGEDLRQPWRLRVEQSNGQLQLLASGSQQAEPIVIGSGLAAGSALVELKLQNNWAFERRTFDGQALSHLYVAHATPLPVLLAEARNGGAPLLAQLPAPPPPLVPEPRPAAVTTTTVRRSTSPSSSSSRQRQAPVSAASTTVARTQPVAATRTQPAPTAQAAATQAPATSSSSSRLARLESLRLGRPRAAGQPTAAADQGGGVIALQVVPYRP